MGKNNPNKLKETYKIDENGKIKDNDLSMIFKDAANNKISSEDLYNLQRMIPDFLELQKDYIGCIKDSLQGAKETQDKTLDIVSLSGNIESLINIINDLMKKNKSEEVDIKILDTIVKITEQKIKFEESKNEHARKINKDNLKFWGTTIASIVGVIVVTFGIFSKLNNKSDKS
jgi:hypothetical protein